MKVKIDSHSPGRLRTNGTLMIQPAFYSVFGLRDVDKMYLATSDRVIGW